MAIRDVCEALFVWLNAKVDDLPETWYVGLL